MVLGDLNVVLNESEKLCEGREVQGVSTELNDFLISISLVDLRYYGQKYTWTYSNTWCKLEKF